VPNEPWFVPHGQVPGTRPDVQQILSLPLAVLLPPGPLTFRDVRKLPARGSGTAAGPMTQTRMPPAGPRAPGWTGPHAALPPYPGWGQGGGHPVPAGQAKAEQTGPGPSSKARLTGQARPAPLRVADGDGMDRHPGAHASESPQ
jgi:hypothetical protein